MSVDAGTRDVLLSRRRRTVGDAEKKVMFEYYDERAPEYELIYTSGAAPASISDPEAYVREARTLGGLVRDLAGPAHVDLACGTGFWLPWYHDRCESITMVDQSEQMLRECGQKIARLGIESKTSVLCADVLEHPFPPAAYDSALVGFLLSHLSPKEEQTLFGALRSMLRPGGRFMIFDSIWNAERAATRSKDGSQTRTLGDGRTFTIPKRYFEPHDLEAMAGRYRARIDILHRGKVYIAASGSFDA